MMSSLAIGGRELWLGVQSVSLWTMLTKRHLRLTYRTSRLGMFWSTLPLGAQMLISGFIYGRLTDAPFEIILPWIVTGLIAWQFFASFITQSLRLFTDYAGLVRNFSRPYYAYLIAAYLISLLQALHNLVLLVLVEAIIGFRVAPPDALTLIFGFLVFTLAVGWLGMPLAIAAIRYPMTSNFVAAVLNLAFVVTPVLFMPSALRAAAWLVDVNPLAHVIAMLRDPLLGRPLSWASIVVALSLAALGWTLSLSVSGRWRDRIAYWV